MTIMKGARIGEYTEKTICCDHCGHRQYYGAIPKALVARLAMQDGWVRVDNDTDIWNLCPDCAVVPTLSTFSQQENYL